MPAVIAPAPALVIRMELAEVPSLNQTTNRVFNRYLHRKHVQEMRGTGRIKALAALGGADFEPLAGPIHLAIHVYRTTRARSDLLNLDLKATLDGFTDAGIWKDDSQIMTSFWQKHIDPSDPRIEFRIFKIEAIKE